MAFKTKSGWRTGVRRQSLARRPATIAECKGAASLYVGWLAEARGWTREQALKYASDQPFGGLLSQATYLTEAEAIAAVEGFSPLPLAA